MSSTAEVLAHFAEQAQSSKEYGSPFMARLLEHMYADIEAGGPTASLVADWPRSPRVDALSLRLTGALHAAVLSGRAPALAAAYPAASPAWDMARIWPLARAFLARERDWVIGFLASPPQTNETRRTIALLAGFLELAAHHDREIELLEIGASAGLNQLWDRFAYRTDSWRWGGDSDVRISTPWTGPPPRTDAALRIRSRAACDLNPIDIRDPAEQARLRAYIWADQAERLARFDAAAALAIAHGVRVDRADAAEWLEDRLPRRAPDALTIVYHSVFYQYPPREIRQRIAATIAKAGETGAPLAWLRLEAEPLFDGPRDSTRFLVDMVTWPGGERRILAVTDGHANFVQSLL